MALYECVLMARQDISTSQAEGLVDQFSEIIEANGGKVTKKEMWGLRTLAYRIKKNRKAHYTLLNLDAPAAAVAEMERNLRLNEDVIRYLTLRVEEHEEGPSIVLQARERRDDRGGRDGGRFSRGGPRGDRGDRGDRGPRPAQPTPATPASESKSEAKETPA
jgi:small subunit ribosomal protein S6